MDTQELVQALAVAVSEAPSADAATVVRTLPADRVAYGIRDNGQAITAAVVGSNMVIGYGDVVELFETPLPELALAVWENGIRQTLARGIVVWDVTP